MKSYGKSHKSNYFSRNREFEKQDRWDHGGFEQLEFEKKNFKKYEKPWSKRSLEGDYHNETIKEPMRSEKTAGWKHDKFEETEKPQSQPDTHKGKKPDQELYKPPRNRGSRPQRQCDSFLSTNSLSQKSEENVETPKTSKNAFDLHSFEDRELKHEEELSSISSESTSHSEKMRTDDNIGMLASEDVKLKNSLINSSEANSADKQSSQSPVFEFSVILPDGKPVDLRLYESNEDDLESVIDAFCEACQVRGELHLHLKTQIVKCIRLEKIFNKMKLDDLYAALLNQNYDLIMKSERDKDDTKSTGNERNESSEGNNKRAGDQSQSQSHDA